MTDLLYQCKVINGILEITHRQKMSEDIRTQCPDGNYEIIIRKKKKRRSNALNRYYWGVVVRDVQIGLKDLGTRAKLQETDEIIRDILKNLTPNSTHAFLKDYFIDKITIDEITGEIIQNENSTKNMTNTQFMEYYIPIYQWGKEYLGIDIPEPNENFDMPQQYETDDNAS